MIAFDEARALAAAAEAERKVFHDLQARFALAAWELVRAEDGALFVCRWGRARRIRDLDDAEAFLQRIGGKTA